MVFGIPSIFHFYLRLGAAVAKAMAAKDVGLRLAGKIYFFIFDKIPPFALLTPVFLLCFTNLEDVPISMEAIRYLASLFCLSVAGSTCFARRLFYGAVKINSIDGALTGIEGFSEMVKLSAIVSVVNIVDIHKMSNIVQARTCQATKPIVLELLTYVLLLAIVSGIKFVLVKACGHKGRVLY